MAANDTLVVQSSWEHSAQTNISLTRLYHERYSPEPDIPSLKELSSEFAPIINGSAMRLEGTQWRVFKDLHKQSRSSGVPVSFSLNRKKATRETNMRLLILVHPVAAQILVPIIAACQAVDVLFQTYYIDTNDSVFNSLDGLEPLEYLA